MAVGPRVEYRVTTVEFKASLVGLKSWTAGRGFGWIHIYWSPLPLTWKVVHEAGLRRYHPLRSGLTEDGDVALGPLAERRQAAAETL